MDIDIDAILTTRDAARLLGVSVSTAQKWMESGILPVWKTPGGHRRVHRAAVMQLLQPAASPLLSATDHDDFQAEPAPAYPVSAHESQRLLAVKRSKLMDSPVDPAFDRLTWLASSFTQTPVAMLTVLSRRRQWFKSSVGTDVTETRRQDAICNHTVMQDDVFVVEDTAADTRFRDIPTLACAPPIRFYAGYPFYDAKGYALGALCVIDHTPRSLSAEHARVLRELGSIAANELRLGQALSA